MHQEHDLPDDLLPPPAYSEQEFEQKVSRATDLSLQSLNVAYQNTDDDGWETYDEDAFEAISNKLAAMELRTTYGQSSSSSSSQIPTFSTTHAKRKSTEKVPLSDSGLAPLVNPLRIEKKGASTYGQSSDGSSSTGQGGPSNMIRNEPEPPPAFTAVPGPDESELNWSRPSSASSSALSPIDSQLFPTTQPAPLLSHDMNSQPGQRQPEPALVPQLSAQEPESAVYSPDPNQPRGYLQADNQPQSSVYVQSNPQPTYQQTSLPSIPSAQPSYHHQSPSSVQPIPPTSNSAYPSYQQASQLSNPSPQPTYQYPTFSSRPGYAALPQIPGSQSAQTGNIQPLGTPHVQPTHHTSSPPPSQLNSPQNFRNSASFLPRQPAIYSSDLNVSTPQPTRQSLPTPPRPQPSIPPQSIHINTSVGHVSHTLAPARLSFNPSLAYGNTFSQGAARPMSTMFTQKPEHAPSAISSIQYNPRELYNNAVSSHLTTLSPRASASSNLTSASMGSTTPQQTTLGFGTYTPYATQNIQGSTAPHNISASQQRTSTYWSNNNMSTQSFQPQYNNQTPWSGQQATMNTGAPLMAQPQNTAQWYSYQSG